VFTTAFSREERAKDVMTKSENQNVFVPAITSSDAYQMNPALNALHQQQRFQLLMNQKQHQLKMSIPSQLRTSKMSGTSLPTKLTHLHGNTPGDLAERINVTVTNQRIISQEQITTEQMTTQQQLRALQQQNFMLMNMLQNSRQNFLQMTNLDNHNAILSMNNNLNYSIANMNNSIETMGMANSGRSNAGTESMKPSTSNSSIGGSGFSNTMFSASGGSNALNAEFPSINYSMASSTAPEAAYTTMNYLMLSNVNDHDEGITNIFNDRSSGIETTGTNSASGVVDFRGMSGFANGFNNSRLHMTNSVEANHVSSEGNSEQPSNCDWATSNSRPEQPTEGSNKKLYSMTQVLSDSPQVDTMPSSLLHQACHLYPETIAVVASAIRLDPSAISRRAQTPADAADDEQRHPKRTKRNGYSLPVNIALKSNASIDVLRVLCQAGPKVLLERDGPEACTALANAIYLDSPVEILQLLIETNPNSSKTMDRHSNLPLHVACSKGCSLQIIQILVNSFPDSVNQKNFDGRTALEIAQRTQVCDDSVIDYLQQATFEAKALNLSDYEDDLLQ